MPPELAGATPRRALQLLPDLAKCRLSGDTYQEGLVDFELDELDAKGGYRRGNRVEGPAELSQAQRRYRRTVGA